jgi:hypothetical protein
MAHATTTDESGNIVVACCSTKNINPVKLDSAWSFADESAIMDAYRKLITGHAAGKVVIKVVHYVNICMSNEREGKCDH